MPKYKCNTIEHNPIAFRGTKCVERFDRDDAITDESKKKSRKKGTRKNKNTTNSTADEICGSHAEDSKNGVNIMDSNSIYNFQRRIVIYVVCTIILMLSFSPIIIALVHKRHRKNGKSSDNTDNDSTIDSTIDIAGGSTLIESFSDETKSIPIEHPLNNATLIDNQIENDHDNTHHASTFDDVPIEPVHKPSIPTIPNSHHPPVPSTTTPINNLVSKINSLNDTSVAENTVRIPTSIDEFF
jgi:hypothetical protein